MKRSTFLLLMQSSTLSYANLIASLTPLVWLKFNETSGTTIVNYGSLGAACNAVWTAGVGALGQTGQLGANNAYDFDGANSIAQITNNAGINGLANFTYLFLAKADTTGEGGAGTLYDWGAGNIHELRFNTGKLIAHVDYDVTDAAQQTAADIPLTSWLWFGSRHNSTTKKTKLYMTAPGATIASEAYGVADTTGANTVVAQVVDLFLGNRSGQNRSWDGLIDEILIFGYELTDVQHQAIVTASAAV